MKLNKKIFPILSILLLFFIVCMPDALFASESKKKQINCDIQNQQCVQPILNGSIVFNIQPKPVKAMKDLIFEVKVKDINMTGSPIIDLSMPGMKMGKNKVKMKMISKGVYQGTGIIVRCPSGKTIWQATINLSGIGSANFIFDVIY